MMIKGLRTGDKELVDAAAQQMHDNAADVAGNSIPVNGGDYNTDARTIADALNMTTAPTATAFDLTSAKGAVVSTTAAVADAGGANVGAGAGGAASGGNAGSGGASDASNGAAARRPPSAPAAKGTANAAPAPEVLNPVVSSGQT